MFTNMNFGQLRANPVGVTDGNLPGQRRIRAERADWSEG